MTDIIVIGGGPAGMTAALYALRNGKSALVLEKAGFGGQITNSPKVENFPGTLVMSGNEFPTASWSRSSPRAPTWNWRPPCAWRRTGL